MVRGEKEKITALVLTVAVLAISCSELEASRYSVGRDATLLDRMVYSFIHASFLHALLNSWSLIVIVFYFNVSICTMAMAYIIAVAYPAETLSHVVGMAGEPTVGLSAVCFALLGSVGFAVRRRIYFNMCIMACIFMGPAVSRIGTMMGLEMAFPNFVIHLYAYAMGLVVSFFNMPAPWKRK